MIAQTKPRTVQTFSDWLTHHWFEIFLVVYGLWVFIPFLAPVFMRIGWSGAGKAIYFIYSFFCHQLPERSYFLFGDKLMYSLRECFLSSRIRLANDQIQPNLPD